MCKRFDETRNDSSDIKAPSIIWVFLKLNSTLAENVIISKKPNGQLARERFERRQRGENDVGLVPKERQYAMIDWLQHPDGRTVTFNRDINAARNILYRALCRIYQREMHPNFTRNGQRVTYPDQRGHRPDLHHHRPAESDSESESESESDLTDYSD